MEKDHIWVLSIVGIVALFALFAAFSHSNVQAPTVGAAIKSDFERTTQITSGSGMDFEKYRQQVSEVHAKYADEYSNSWIDYSSLTKECKALFDKESKKCRQDYTYDMGQCEDVLAECKSGCFMWGVIPSLCTLDCELIAGQCRWDAIRAEHRCGCNLRVLVEQCMGVPADQQTNVQACMDQFQPPPWPFT